MKKAKLIFLIFVLLPGFLYASAKETINPEEIYVGDKVDYEIEFDSGIPDNLSIPEGEVYVETSPDLPAFKILSIEKKQNKIHLTIRFYEAGDYTLPIAWEENNKTIYAEKIIKVKSQLTGEEKELQDIEPPVTFSGSSFLRLSLFFLFLFAIGYLIYVFYLYRKKNKKIVDATWEKIPSLENRFAKLYLIEGMLRSETVNIKDLVYQISSYCKEEYSHRLSFYLLSFTDEEFLTYLYDRSSLTDQRLREIRSFFRESKYTDKNGILTGEDANRLWIEWKEKLGL
ncbi:LB_053 family protein [Leptospira sp. 'Mane']|uniref:LB_053 family protein n=1 Tax=Leptospira sp. 'Mane' TaxID=3387407 RepID=UPI00398B915F